MEAIQKINILIGLDLSEMDEALIRYVQLVRKLYPVSTITFLHNVKISELPEEFRSQEKLAKIATGIKSKIKNLIEAGESIPEPYQVEVTLADFSEMAFLDISKRTDAKLVMLGNKQQLLGGGGLPQKLIRMLPLAVLLVPETFNPQPKRIVEAIDFSKYTDVVYRIGKQIMQHVSLDEFVIEPVYIAKVSWQFFPGPSQNDIKKILEEDAKLKQKKWSKSYPDSAALTIITNQDKNIASSLLDHVKKTKTDFLIMGAMGASSLTGLFMGSVANEIIQQETNTSILLVKRQIS